MTRIDNIEIKNFKSIRDANISDCRRVNVFIGYPNVGKSNIIEALGLYSTLHLKGNDFNFNDICRVKHFSELFFNQDYSNKSEIILNSSLELELVLENDLNLSMTCSRLIDHQKNLDDSAISALTISKDKFDFSGNINVPASNYNDLSSPVMKYQFKGSSEINKQTSGFLAIPYGINLLDILQGNGFLRKQVANLFEEYSLRLAIDKSDMSFKLIKELPDKTIVIIPYHQVADTLRRLIFYKAAILSNKDSILLFEEPEAHMFPPYITKFTSDIIFDENNNQYFLATHSPFVLNDFMEDMDEEDLSIYVVGLKDGETIIRRLNNDEVTEIYQYGIDLFFNLENFLKDAV